MKLKLFEEGVDLIDDTPGIQSEQAPTGSKFLYIAANNAPRLFAILSNYAGTLAPQAAFDEGCFRVQLVRRQDGFLLYNATPSIDFEPAPPSPSAPQAAPFAPGIASPETSPSGAGGYTVDQVTCWFKFLFGGYGERLLNTYIGLGGTIELDSLSHLTNWHGYTVKNWKDSDRNAGRKPVIVIDSQQKTVVHAAKALFFAMDEFRSPWARYDFNIGVTDRAFAEALTGDASIDDAIREFNRGHIVVLGEALGDCVTAAEIGLSLAAEPANWIFTLSDAADRARAGKYGEAGVMLGVGVILTGPVMKVAKRSGKTIVIHSVDSTLVISGKLRDVLVDVTDKMPRYKVMERLVPLLESGELTEDAIAFIYHNSKLLAEPRTRLEANLIAAGKPRPKGCVPHHMLPIIPNELREPMELTFLKRGLDPNDAKFGQWLRKDIHDKIHGVGSAGQGWGAGGAWNYQWKRYFEDNAKTGEAEVRTFLDTLRGVLDDVIANPSRSLLDYDWPYKPGA